MRMSRLLERLFDGTYTATRNIPVAWPFWPILHLLKILHDIVLVFDRFNRPIDRMTFFLHLSLDFAGPFIVYENTWFNHPTLFTAGVVVLILEILIRTLQMQTAGRIREGPVFNIRQEIMFSLFVGTAMHLIIK